MCSRVSCPQCKKPDWRGCGAHVESVLGDVPKQDRCKCREDGTSPAAGTGLLGMLFGRR